MSRCFLPLALSRLSLAFVAALPMAANAQMYGLSANVITEVINFPAADRQVGSLELDRDPSASVLQALDRQAQLGPGSVASGKFLGSTGVLKAYAAASYPLGGDGMASSTVTSSFSDTIRVSGAGLAVGTPVSYRVDFSIQGSVLGGPPGSNFGAFANASVALQDDFTRQSVFLNWSDKTQTPGVYSLVLNTQVGRSLVLYGTLAVGARVQGNSPVGRFAEADFYNSAVYSLAPSVAGLNTVGASGHDFTVSSVPEPSSGVLLGAGLLALVRLQSRRARR